ncbi:hypothetical protein FQN54_005271 [Arachnomyces sp. PD_36]|nr:hypothetical protein FQN54_005271 [Arachnomyces sp. PD_36]
MPALRRGSVVQGSVSDLLKQTHVSQIPQGKVEIHDDHDTDDSVIYVSGQNRFCLVIEDSEDEGSESKVEVSISVKRARSEIPDTEDEDDEIDGEIISQDPEEDAAPAAERVPIVVYGLSLKLNEAFERVVRTTITHLVEWANGNQLLKIDPGQRLMILGFWKIFIIVSVDFLVFIYLSAVPLTVQALFEEGKTWFLQYFLSLISASAEKRQGGYCDIATGNIAHSTDIQCDAYVGSSYSAYQRSFHYGQICRTGVKANFIVLAAFNQPVPRGYLCILETVFMILLKTYSRITFITRHACKESYDIVEIIQASQMLSSVSWGGMNAAWPLSQGFVNGTARARFACKNPACDKMTYLTAETAALKIARRRLADSEDPLGAYLCGTCGEYRNRNEKELSDASHLRRLAALKDARKAAGDDAACYTCGRLESQFREHHTISTAGRTSISSAKFRLHKLVLGAMFCHVRGYHNDRKGRLHTEEETEEFLQMVNLAQARQAGAEIVCENCAVVEGFATSGKTYVYKHGGEHRDSHLQRRAEVKHAMDGKRKAGTSVICVYCGKRETRTTLITKFRVGKSLKTVCISCIKKVGD